MCDDVVCLFEEWGIDFEVEVVVIIGDVLMSVLFDDVLKVVWFVMFVNDVLLCNLILVEFVKGFGFF